MRIRHLMLGAIAFGVAILLFGCASDSDLAGRPFGETESLYHEPQNTAEFIEIAQDATLHVFCEVEDEDLPYAGSGFHIEVGDSRYIITNAHVIAACIDQAGELVVYDSEDNPHIVTLLSYRHVRDWRGEWDVAVLSGRDLRLRQRP